MDSTTWIPEGFKEEEIDGFTDDDFLALSQKVSCVLIILQSQVLKLKTKK